MIDVVGVGADGLSGLPAPTRALVDSAEVVIAAERLAEGLPAHVDVRPWPSPMRTGLPALLAELAGRRVVALASGDPFVAGAGGTLVDLLGPEGVRVHPAVSSVALARARMGWPSDSCTVVRLRGRDLTPLRREMAPGVRLIVLSGDAESPSEVAAILTVAGFGGSTLTLLGDLGANTESRATCRADEFALAAPRLNLVCVEVAGRPAPVGSRTPGLPDDAYSTTRGQLTKRHVRATALAMLAPQPGELLWDLGTGSGSVAIEWARSHPTCRALAVERDPQRAALAHDNAARLGAVGVEVVEGESAEVVGGLATPDAVFIGGGVTRDLIDATWAALRPGGRIVVHAVTLETQALLLAARSDLGGDMFEIAVREAEPIGRYTGWASARPVHQWVAHKPITSQESQ
ncbi:precorrin-6Y C5,15-methyltransferase (decarboxylating) subunit CbiT [Mariniluteicoccus endophyticus]